MAWRKSWSGKNLDPNGTKRSMTPVERSVWDDVLDLAAEAPVTGQLCAFTGVPYTVQQLSEIFKTPIHDVTHAMKRFFELGLIDEKYQIVTWFDHQSEYQRTKQYRATQNATTNATQKGTSPDIDTDTDKTKTLSALRASAREVLSFLNEKAEKKIPYTEPNLDPIVARLKEGFTVAQCKQVIVRKVREWITESKEPSRTRVWVRVKTLFKRENFHNYIGELVTK